MNISSEKKEEFSLKSIFNLCKMHKKFLILFIGIIVVLTGVYSFIIPQKFTATTTVLPPEDEGTSGGLSGFLQSISGGISLGGMSKGLKIELYLEMLTSRSVAEYIVNECNLTQYEDFKIGNKNILYDMVRNLLEVEANRSGLMIISTTIKTPYFPNSKDKIFAAELAAKISNAAIEGLDYINRKKSSIKAKKKKEFISRILVENKKMLDSVDMEMEKFQKENKLVAIDEQTQAILENIVGVGVELSKAEVELGIISQEFEPASPIVKAYERQVEDLAKQYEKTQSGGLIPTDKFSIPLDEVPTLLRKYTNLLRDQKILTQVILYLETQKYQEAIQEESDILTVQALDEAFPPYRKSSPSRLIMLFISFFISSFLGISYIIIKALKKGNLYIEKEEEKIRNNY
jgi:tyrosine-protein kinase Etk/Wzc